MKNKKICLITTERHSLIKDIIKYAQESGIETDVLSIRDVAVLISSSRVHSNLLDYGAIYFDRGEEDWVNYGFQITFLHSMKQLGARIFNNPLSYMLAHDKVTTSIELAARGIPVAETVICYDVGNALAAIKEWPVIILKPPLGYSGNGISVFENKDVSSELLAAKLEKQGNLYLQKFVKSTRPRDIRVQVVDGRAVLTYERVADSKQKYPLCNIDLGARMNFISLPDQAVAVALKAVAILGLDVAGVDLLVDEHENFLVSEINPETTTLDETPIFGREVADFLIGKCREV